MSLRELERGYSEGANIEFNQLIMMTIVHFISSFEAARLVLFRFMDLMIKKET